MNNLKDSMSYLSLLVILVIERTVADSDTLDCFKCEGIESIDDCHTTTTCRPSEHCYAETYTNKTTGKIVYTLGCRENEFCVGMEQMFGKRDSPPVAGCVQCCTLHGCNKYLCPLRYANPVKPVNGAWSIWGPWSNCDVSCDYGLRARYRACNNPPPSDNGRLCLGDAKDVKICHADCTGHIVPIKTTKTATSPPSTATTTKVTLPPKTTTTTSSSTTSPIYVTHDLTQAPGGCKDLIDCSGYYRPDACFGVYSAWAHRYCPVHCGFCGTPSPVPCVDTLDNCHEYQDDLCTKPDFWQWRESHCRKFCKLC